MSFECRSCLSAGSYSPTAQSTTTEQRRSRISFSTMAKFVPVIFVIFVILIIVQGELGESPTTARSRQRAKTIKKKKPSTTVAPVEEYTTTLAPIDNIQDGGNNFDEEPGDAALDSDNDEAEDKVIQGNQSEEQVSTRRPSTSKSTDCGVCDIDECTSASNATCPTGLVLDRCSCCLICGAGEGNRCYNASLNLRYNPDIGICGPGLSCLLRSDLEATEPPEALCECQDPRMVCGSNNQTYSSECKLHEMSHYNPELVVKHRGPCISAPWISTPVENTTIGYGEDVSMSCEVRGYPPPIIHWEFLEEKSNAVLKILPGDDSSVVIVVRGGPEQMMTTSWIQIISVTTSRQGTYFCIAKNAEGTIKSFATVSVIPAITRHYNDHI